MSSFRCTFILFLAIASSVISAKFKPTTYRQYQNHFQIPQVVAPITIQFQSANNGQIQWSENCDFGGGDLGSIASAKEKCGDICAQKKECTHFTWNVETCMPKNFDSGSVTPTIYAGAICGYVVAMSWKLGANGRIIWSSNCDFSALDIQEKGIESSKDDCLNHCANNRKCTHFSYQNGAGICWLKQVDNSNSITPILNGDVLIHKLLHTKLLPYLKVL